MKPSDYTSVEKFPLTSQKGLSVQGQLLIDAHNLDALRGHAADNPLTEREKAVLAELEAKAQVAPAVRAAMAGG